MIYSIGDVMMILANWRKPMTLPKVIHSIREIVSNDPIDPYWDPSKGGVDDGQYY